MNLVLFMFRNNLLILNDIYFPILFWLFSLNFKTCILNKQIFVICKHDNLANEETLTIILMYNIKIIDIQLIPGRPDNYNRRKMIYVR